MERGRTGADTEVRNLALAAQMVVEYQPDGWVPVKTLSTLLYPKTELLTAVRKTWSVCERKAPKVGYRIEAERREGEHGFLIRPMGSSVV